MKTPIFKLSSLLILPAALLLQSAPARATEPETVVSIPAALILPAALLLVEYAEPEAAPALPIAAENPVPPSPLMEWFGLGETTAEEPPAAICELQPPPVPGDDSSLLTRELPPMVVESPPLPATDWPENIIEAQDLSRGLGIDPAPALDFPLRESAQQWFDSTRR